MPRLKTRVRKAEYFTDGELLRWHRDKRQTYTGLWAMADDSGCLEDDAFEWKCSIWSSPMDADITIEMLQQWRDEFVASRKLVPYQGSDGKPYLYIRTFHRHEHPRNPGAPMLPLPSWVVWHSYESGTHRGFYEIISEPSENGNNTKTKALLPALVEDDTDFTLFWEAYPRIEGKKDAATAWRRINKANRRMAIGVACIMSQLISEGVKEKRFVPYPATFLRGERWSDWAEGVPPDWEDIPATRQLTVKSDISKAISEIYGDDPDPDDDDCIEAVCCDED